MNIFLDILYIKEYNYQYIDSNTVQFLWQGEIYM
jgi:hypothetical protein